MKIGRNAKWVFSGKIIIIIGKPGRFPTLIHKYPTVSPPGTNNNKLADANLAL